MMDMAGTRTVTPAARLYRLVEAGRIMAGQLWGEDDVPRLSLRRLSAACGLAEAAAGRAAMAGATGWDDGCDELAALAELFITSMPVPSSSDDEPTLAAAGLATTALWTLQAVEWKEGTAARLEGLLRVDMQAVA